MTRQPEQPKIYLGRLKGMNPIYPGTELQTDEVSNELKSEIFPSEFVVRCV